ncbi:hypothetical protein Tco_1271656 [Tanacetum coccineum]
MDSLRDIWDTWKWEEANNFVTFSFFENNKDVEVKECGVRAQDSHQEIPTASQHGGAISLSGLFGQSNWYDYALQKVVPGGICGMPFTETSLVTCY